jgi:hypothetical protein
MLPVALSSEEKLQLAEQLCVAAQRMNEEQVAQDQLKSRMKERMQAVTNDYQELFNTLRRGYVDQEVVCLVETKGGTTRIWRSDTMELVEERPATEEEIQMDFSIELEDQEPKAPDSEGDDDLTPAHHPV